MLVFDVLLAAGLVAVAWRALAARELQASIVLYIAFGLLMSVAWARLRAPDVALAEAAIGAGVTGALLLEAVARMPPTHREARELGRAVRAAGGVAAGMTAVAVAAAALALTAAEGGIGPLVDERLGATGADHGVTAVLLDFRAYDTWLELAVLLAAVMAMLAVLRIHEPPRPSAGRAGDVLSLFGRALVPLMLLVALYVLWRGTKGPGGAFQAGALLAGAGILVYATRIAPAAAVAAWRMRWPLGVGVTAFAALGFFALATGRQAFAYPDGAAGAVVLAIEVAVTLATAATLAAVLAAVDEAAEEGEP